MDGQIFCVKMKTKLTREYKNCSHMFVSLCSLKCHVQTKHITVLIIFPLNLPACWREGKWLRIVLYCMFTRSTQTLQTHTGSANMCRFCIALLRIRMNTSVKLLNAIAKYMIWKPKSNSVRCCSSTTRNS